MLDEVTLQDLVMPLHACRGFYFGRGASSVKRSSTSYVIRTEKGPFLRQWCPLPVLKQELLMLVFQGKALATLNDLR